MEKSWENNVHLRQWGHAAETEVEGVEVLPSCFSLAGDQSYGLRSAIYVREDYKTGWKHIFEGMKGPQPSDGFVVWGHPGIGKSLFFRFVFAKALENKIPIALCEAAFVFYFDKDGARQMTYAEAETITSLEPVLALFDTDYEMESPLPPFTNGVVDCFIVQTRSIMLYEPQKWEVGRRLLNWPIRLWSEGETAIQQRLLSPPSVTHYSATEISRYLGPNPRSCSKLIIKTGNPGSDFKDCLVRVRPGSFSALLIDYSNDPRYVSDAFRFHTYFFAYPRPLPAPLPGPVSLSEMFTYHIPTTFLRNEVLQQFQQFPYPNPTVDPALFRAISSEV
ncbi:hypothetical protein C8J56DRAFT_325393 [Mycena floridula]|nr:hypothetical protein C8J56DRAFT_325393 [Mycena floridula]